jgi:hypothetical protein
MLYAPFPVNLTSPTTPTKPTMDTPLTVSLPNTSNFLTCKPPVFCIDRTCDLSQPFTLRGKVGEGMNQQKTKKVIYFQAKH